MREPRYTGSTDLNEQLFRDWAYENAKYAKRLAEAVMAYRVHLDEETYNEMVRAQLDYENS